MTQVIDQDNYLTNQSESATQREDISQITVYLLMNPDGLPTSVQAGDIYMMESFSRQRNNFSVISGPVVGQEPPLFGSSGPESTGP